MEWTKLMRSEDLVTLQANHREQFPRKGTPRELDLFPVVRLHLPQTSMVWLLSECDEEGLAFGLACIQIPEMGYIYLPEMLEVKQAGYGIRQDLNFRALRTLSQYATLARSVGYIPD